MFEVPNDPEMNEALRDAIKSSSREMYDVVYFDWDADGTYDHEYTDLSSIVVDARLERALTSDLPEGYQYNTRLQLCGTDACTRRCS